LGSEIVNLPVVGVGRYENIQWIEICWDSRFCCNYCRIFRVIIEFSL